jgi:predicted AAA+ superfamily ATPase
MDGEVGKKKEQAQALIKQGLYDQAVIIGGQMLESLYRWLYKEVQPRLKPQEQQSVSRSVEKHGKAVGDLTMGELAGLFEEMRLYDIAERELKQDFSFLKKAQMWRDLRNRATHPQGKPGDKPITRQEAEAFLSTVDLYFQQAGLADEERSLPGNIKPWHQVAIPHRDIREGKFDESVFAADLSEVVSGRGPVEYTDADTFFRKTHPTQGLLKLLSMVLSRLAGQGKGEAVIQIQTPFGGGKTHSLVALYHLLKHGANAKHTDAVKAALKESGLDEIPSDVRVLTFVGTAADALQGKTPWGEFADQLGRYDLLKEHDQKRRSPGKDKLYELLKGEPKLILMDEIAEYCVKARDFSDQLMAFVQELTEAVKVLPQCVLVATLPSSVPYGFGKEGERAEQALQQLQRIFGRVETIYTPVEGEELYEVIRKRLFEDLGDPQEARRVAEDYWHLYQKLGDDVPAELRQPAYRDKIRKAYPFHPELIDGLFERWSTFPTFQRTRGVLRLLAEVVADLYKGRNPAPLIQPAHLNLNEPGIRREFIKHIGNEFEGVVASDIVDGNAKAQQIDREMGSEYARFGVASGLASAIFFYSFSGSAEKRGAGIGRLRIAMLRSEIPSSVVGDAVRRLEEDLWYLHAEGGLYYFTNQANLNKVILEKEEAVREDQLAEEIRSRMEKIAGSEMKVFLGPATSSDLPDNRERKLAVLSTDHVKQNETTASLADEIVNRSGQSFRNYRNAILVLGADSGELGGLRQQVKRMLALKSIQADKSLTGNLSTDNKHALESKLRDAEGGIGFRILTTYRHLARATGDKVEWLDLGLPTVGERASLAKRVIEYLRAQEILLPKIAPRQVLQKTLSDDTKEKALGEIYEAYLKYPNLPMLESEDVLHDAIQLGVRDGFFALRSNGRLYLNESVPFGAMDAGALLVRKEVAEAEVVSSGAGASGGSSVPSQPAGGVQQPPPTPGTPTPPTESRVHQLKLRIQVPWDKMADFVRGVLMPLRGDGADIDVEVSLTARSQEGLKKTTLDHKVKETLNQIGAKILDEQQK